MSARKSLPELIREAGFAPGQFDQSRHLRGRICDGTASAEDQLAYQPHAAAWSRYSELLAERDQLDAVERQAPDPARHTGDDALGAAFRAYRDNQPPPKVVVRSRLIQVDMGEGGLQNIPEAQPLPLYRGSADATGHQRIAAGLTAATKKR